MWRIKNIWIGIVNFWRFRKEVYNFRNWDYDYNMNLFLKSLEITADGIEKEKAHENYQKYVKDIRSFISDYKNYDDTEIHYPEYDEVLANPIRDNAKTRDMANTWNKVEENNYNTTMDFLKDNMRNWWS